ncbi:unnamed protein product [Alopecurus aequalis]
MRSSADHFASNNNHLYFQPDHLQSLTAGTMEAWDLDQRISQSGHEERHGSQQGQGAGEGRSESDPRAVLTTYLTFLEHKIGHLRGILCSTPRPQQQHAIVSAKLRCIIVQLVSIADDLATSREDDADHAGSPPLSNSTHDDSDHAEEATATAVCRCSRAPVTVSGDGRMGSYEVVQLEKEEILAPHTHACKPGHSHSSPVPDRSRRLYYSCPYIGCKRNREHKDFQPLKTPVSVKNHYRRSHCDKSHLCSRCGVKRFSVIADLRTYEKHCGLDRWVCSCGTSFSRKDKLNAHVALFDGHTPAPPPDEDDATVHCSTANATATATRSIVTGCSELLLADGEAVNVMDQCSSGSMFDDFRCSGVTSRMDDGRGQLPSPVGVDFFDFEGFHLFRAVAMDF